MKKSKTLYFTKHKLIYLFLVVFLQVFPVFAQPNSFIWLQTAHGKFKIPALERRGRVSVDVFKLAESLGAGTRVSNDIYVMQFSSETIKINAATNIFSLKGLRDPQWKHVHFKEKTTVDKDRLYVYLEALPVLLNQSFTYHLQRRTLSLGGGIKPAEVKGYKNVPVRFVLKDQKIWLSVEDLSKTMGVLVYSFRVGSYSLLLPDSSILELSIGGQTLLRQRQPYKQLNDPVLAFLGSPYVTLPDVNNIFENDIRWDSASKTVLIPTDYGRLREVQVTDIPKLVSIGYRPEPFNFNLEEFRSYYQEPGPTYVASNNTPYESVRDFITNLPIPKNDQGLDQISGDGVAGMRGSLFKAPFEARGSFEKVGGTGRVVNGGFKWGFPVFQLEGGREYLTFGGLDSQFGLVDQVSVSHANDHYGEGTRSNNWQIKALYGESDFSVFSSTQFLTQSTILNQKIAMVELGSGWNISPRQSWGLKLNHYEFKNEPKSFDSSYDTGLIDFINDILESTEPVTVDPEEQLALLKTVVADRHSNSILDIHYIFQKAIEIEGIGALSHYKEDSNEANKDVYDSDWKVRALIGGPKRRMEVSHESIGDRYRSVGNPFAYQDKRITRIAPYLHLAQWWKLFGEVRKEDIGGVPAQEIFPYSNKYISATNIFNFKQNVVRMTANEYDSTLYGRRLSGNLDLTQYLGKNSVDIGGGGTRRYDSTRRLYQRSTTGRSSFQLTRPDWKFTLGEDYTHHHYLTTSDGVRYESVSNMLLQIKGFRTLLQYQIEPRYYYEKEYLYTGLVRMGYEVGESKFLDLFFATSGLRSNLSEPEVWRVGFEFTVDLY